MKNLTLAIDDTLLRDARKVAIDQGTTVNELVRLYLTALVKQKSEKEMARRLLEQAMATGLGRVGTIHWTRDDLHER